MQLPNGLPSPYYDRAGIVIYHADSRELLPLFEPASIDLTLTDPPYGVGMKYDDAYIDRKEGYEELVLDVFSASMRISKIVMITPGIRNIRLYPEPTWIISWAKPGSTRRSDLGGFNEWEPVLMFGKRRIYNDFVNLPDIANHSKETGDHPCPKPLKLGRWLIERGSDRGGGDT